MEKVKEKTANPIVWMVVLIILLAIAAFVLWLVGERAIPPASPETEAQAHVQNLLGNLVVCPEVPGNIDSVEVEKLIIADLDGDGQKELVLCAWVVRDPFGHGLPEAEEPAP